LVSLAGSQCLAKSSKPGGSGGRRVQITVSGRFVPVAGRGLGEVLARPPRIMTERRRDRIGAETEWIPFSEKNFRLGETNRQFRRIVSCR
jgi:hypothetical protein